MMELRAKIAQKVSEHEAHRTIKVFRALWKLLPSFGIKVAADADPSKAVRNRAPDARQAMWQYYEVLLLVQGAWREGYYGLAALIAVAWETMMSPVDVRTLTAGQRKRDVVGSYFGVARAKTGRAAAGTLERYAEAVLDAYLRNLTADGTVALHDTTPLFWTRGGMALGPKGGRPWKPAPYTMDKLGKDFRKVREAIFGPDETRQLADMRRSGAVEADTGGVDTSDLAHKMANRVDTADFIRKTYTPVNLAAVRRANDARKTARRKLDESK